jgi:hypothetical protein
MLTTTTGSAKVLIRSHLDFNTIRWVRKPRYARIGLLTNPWRPNKGDGVLVYDAEGNECEGVVERLTSWGCYAMLDMNTWRDGEQP